MKARGQIENGGEGHLSSHIGSGVRDYFGSLVTDQFSGKATPIEVDGEFPSESSCPD